MANRKFSARRGLKLTKNTLRLLGFMKWFSYGLTIVLAYVFSTSLSADTVKPLLLIPVAICISAFCTEIPAMIIGTVCGLLLDMSLGYIVGGSAVILICACVATSLLFVHLLRGGIINTLLLTLLTIIIYITLAYYFNYKAMGYVNYEIVLKTKLIPSAIKTFVFTPFVYAFIRLITRGFRVPDFIVPEKHDGTIERV